MILVEGGHVSGFLIRKKYTHPWPTGRELSIVADTRCRPLNANVHFLTMPEKNP
jgi:hypothetical protein